MQVGHKHSVQLFRMYVSRALAHLSGRVARLMRLKTQAEDPKRQLADVASAPLCALLRHWQEVATNY